jgi:membrane protein implicated in regulation of membrane protease activity
METSQPMDFWMLFWGTLGIVLIFSELLLPGGIAFFMGAGALFVAALHLLGLVNSPLSGFTIWFVLSTVMMFTLKGLVDKFLPHITSRGNIDEEVDAFGTVVKVVEEIAHDKPGRIEYMGTTWPALAKQPDGHFRPGDHAVLIFKDNLTWLVDTPPNNNN